MKTTIACAIFSAALAAGTTFAADGDKAYTKEQFKSDVKSAGKGIKDSAVEVGHQVRDGTKKAWNADKAKVKKDVKDRKPGDGTYAKKNDAQPNATPGHN